jgi:hypothetical protein
VKYSRGFEADGEEEGLSGAEAPLEFGSEGGEEEVIEFEALQQ